MKRELLGIFCLILIITIVLVPAFAAETSWTKVTDDAAFSPRAYFSMQIFNDKMWVIGGLDNKNTYYNDVWYTTDGKTWNSATRSAPFTPRYGHTTVVFDDKMWVIGGYDSSHTFRNDVWYTTDGISWLQATPRASFQPRHLHTSIVFNGRMWVIGGEITEKPWIYTNDVWYSSDGKTWVQATSSAPFSPRMGSGSAVFDNKMWVIGGVGDTYGKVRYNDVWSSSDGKTWELQTSSAGFSSRYDFPSVTTSEDIWVIGGVDGEKAMSDIWFSSDGKTWSNQSSGNMYSPRYGHGVVVFMDRIWVTGGSDQTGRYFNDVWYSEVPASPSQSTGIVVNKSVSPRSIKQGTEARVSITFTNAGGSPVHDIEILDTSLPEFPVISGANQTAIPDVLMPNETRILVYAIQSTEAGRFTLPKASVMYAGYNGNYYKIQSNAPSIEVLSPLLSQENPHNGRSGGFFNDMVNGILSILSGK